MVVIDEKRISGSTEEFEKDWQYALADPNKRFVIFPTLASGRQFDLFEWVKAREIDAILDHKNIKSGKVLEYGCGSAGISLYLASKGFQSYICDLSVSALRVARLNHALNTPDACDPQAAIADAMTLPYDENSFDIVMSFGVLEHFEKEPLERLLNETVRVLKPGGLFLADIVPGPEKFSVRVIGLYINFISSFVYHFFKGDWFMLKSLFGQYFEHYYETSYREYEWHQILLNHKLTDVNVNVCRPFPPLAIAGKMENFYTRLIRHFLPVHFRFDRMNSWFTRHWGWMYLATALKPTSDHR